MNRILTLLLVAACGGADPSPDAGVAADVGRAEDVGQRDANGSTRDGASVADSGLLDMTFDATMLDATMLDATMLDATMRADAGLADAPIDGGHGFECDPSIGSVRPVETCSVANPCVDLLVTVMEESVTTEADPAVCRTTSDSRTAHDDGAAQRHPIAGLDRESCEFRVAGASGAPRPLLLFFHGAGGAVANVYNGTSLRDKAESFRLSGVAARTGFHLVAVQARNLHWPTADPRDGSHHDIFHRDLSSPSTNPDIAHADDAIVDAWVATGEVDTNRIYVTGWSNGGFFAQMYAIARHETATPGGAHVAAAAVYTAADPFHEAEMGVSPSCRLSTYPRSTVPLFLVGRACDLIACDEAQAADLRRGGGGPAPGAVVETWLGDLLSRVGNPNASRQIVAANGRTMARCTRPAFCGGLTATLNHTRWPDGVADRSGIDHEVDMLTFLRDHPLR